MLYNDELHPFGADGVLVLNGGQGIGKTSLFRRLALRPQWFGEGATIKDNDKDTLRRCITRWITELGEVESTLKSDISALKAFVTSDTDVYRTPYARADRKAARRTSLCATCNSDRYLIDTTGNRRWWSVPLSQPMDFNKIQQFNAEQLWAEIFMIVSSLDQTERAACFRLTRSEQAALAIRNGEFEKPLKGELECRDLIAEAYDKDFVWTFMSVTEWRNLNLNALRSYSVQQIGAALERIGIKQEQRRVDGHPVRGRYLPSGTTTPVEIRRIK
jgi:putative DNA primase/helicase